MAEYEGGGLSRAELAALDLLIADLQGETAGSEGALANATEARLTPVVARTAIVVTRVATRFTPQLIDLVGARRISAEAADATGAVGGDLSGVSVDDLIELRRRLQG